ncbi:amino acid permease-domain-containing protein [Lasiosphaeria hispida]|uniref:Amino acid permease-domain-containing protein n=1 Tax=Lasiosphaeria hispida TaxID=260671 RepID=A0AAJ0HUJ8_9PEZI|nr:amino acid permease-domain-containing protein [Lasiosphaeria hispida]
MAVDDSDEENTNRAMPDARRDSEKLRKSLNGVQVFFIIVSTVIGTGVFSGNGSTLAVAGPLGLLLNVVGVGLVAVCVGETVSELVQLWTVPNAVYYYIKQFVDTEAAWVVTGLYWYANAAVFAVQMLGAAKLVQFWDLTAIWPPFIFYLVVPFLLLSLNLAGISVYGWAEIIFGTLKSVLILGVTCTLYDISTKNGYAGPEGRKHPPAGKGNILGTPIQYNFYNAKVPLFLVTLPPPPFGLPSSATALTLSALHARSYGIPQVAYSYIGIESAVVAAFESKDAQAVARPSQYVHWFIFVLYFLCTLGIALTVRWDDTHLTLPLAGLSHPKSNSPTIIAIAKDPRLGATPLPGFVNGCLIMSIISSAGASLYLAGRTLFGLAYSVPLQGRNLASKAFGGLRGVWEKTGVPAKALLVTMLAFFWLPWLSEAPQGKGVAVEDALKVLGLTASMSCIITWAFLCLAFIRYHIWAKKWENSLTGDGPDLSQYDRSSKKYADRIKGISVAFQPWIATTGFLGCVIVSISASAPWWAHPARAQDVLAATPWEWYCGLP